MSDLPLSAWCAMAPGITIHASACLVCEMRQRDKKLPPCGCAGHKKKDAA